MRRIFSDMLGAIVGDIAGSTFERHNFKFESCPIFAKGSIFTDDTVLTVATADAILSGGDYAECYQKHGRRYPAAGYGPRFAEWLREEAPRPYNSDGNGSAMRVSPVGLAAPTLEWALAEAERSAMVSHDHPNGIRGAQAVATAIFLAREGESKEGIREYIERGFGYDLHRTVESIRPSYSFHSSCEASVQEAIVAFLDSKDFEDAIRKAISLGGDSDTIASIAGAIADAYYGGVPEWMGVFCKAQLDAGQVAIVEAFLARYPRVAERSQVHHKRGTTDTFA
jgi:ADP-ribosylglycohydrolase